MIQKSNQKVLSLLMLLMLALTGSMEVKAQETSDFRFNSGVRYSQWVTNSRIGNYYANTTANGFAKYNAEGTQISGRTDGKSKLDYVPGLVAKAVIENVQYYSQYQWAQSWALPFFYSIADYGNAFYNQYASTYGSLDDLNASKLYFGLYELTNTGGAYASNSIASTTKAHAQEALRRAMEGENGNEGIIKHNSDRRIENNTPAYLAGHTIVEGGWWHKTAYENEMWLDGSYMGPALFAQLHNYKGSDIISDDWTIVYRQIQALWEMCWNPTDKLLYHAFSAQSKDNYSATWAGFDPDNGVFHSASYWGRACGWYFLALIDILEQMDKAGLSNTTNYATLKSHLSDLCEGLAARQDATSGCWYQLLDEDGEFSADSYSGKSFSTTYNYLESSASALFAAGFMKAIRLGYISSATYESVAKKAYEGLVNTFMAADGNDGVHLFGSCRSAGLGGTNKNMPRDGSKAYYLLGGDVAKVAKSENVTEGKILGAFILAATEYEQEYQDNTVLFERDLAKTYEFEESGELSCPASGSGTSPTYQWYKNGTAIEGATNATLAVTTSGNYYCEATSSGKTIQSSTAAVTVTPPPTVLYSTDFSDSKWSGITSICAGDNAANETYNGITFHSSNSTARPFTISQSAGTMTWCNNGMGDKYWIAIPVTGVNGSLTITVDNGTTATKFKYVIKQETTISGSPGSGTDNSSSTADPATVTINDLDKSDYVVYLGRSSSSYSTVTSIKITTPASSGGDDPTPTTYTVSYNMNGHGDAIASVEGVTALPSTLPTPTATGYTFGGWYTDSGLNTAATAGASISANTTLYAKWTEKAAATVSINPNSGNVTVGSTLDISSYVTAGNSTGAISYSTGDASKATVTNAGVITGVAEGSANITVTQDEDANYKTGSVTFTITVNAVPTPTTNYTVKFYNGTEELSSSEVAKGTEVEAPTSNPTKDGYTFKGWTTTEGGTLRVVFPYPVYSNVNFYAVWSNTTSGGGGGNFSATATAKLEVPANTTSGQGISSDNATISGGVMYVYNGQDAKKELITNEKGSTWAFLMSNSDTFFKVTLDNALVAGDKIKADIFGPKMKNNNNNYESQPRGLWMSTATSRPSSAPTATLSVTNTSTSSDAWLTSSDYTVTTGDGICGEKTFYIYRATANSTYFTDFTVTTSSTGNDITLDATTDYENFNDYVGANKNVTLKRSFTEGKWTTLVLPFSVTAEQLNAAFTNASECEIAKIKSMNVTQGNGSIHYTTVSSIEANKPVLAKIKPNANGEYVFNGVTVVAPESVVSTSTDGKIEMHGVYKTTGYTQISSDSYFLSGGKFYDWSYLNAMSPFSAYLLPVGENAQSVQSISFDDEATGIVNVNGNGNGNANENESYNLAGQRVTKEYNGIVIIKGKKVFTK